MTHHAEFHDARISQASTSAGVVTLTLAHIAVYCPKSEEAFDVWSYEAELRFEEVESVSDVLPTGTIYEANGLPDLMDVLGEDSALSGSLNVDRVEIFLTDATTLVVVCRRVTLQLGRRKRWMDLWEGPL